MKYIIKVESTTRPLVFIDDEVDLEYARCATEAEVEAEYRRQHPRAKVLWTARQLKSMR